MLKTLTDEALRNYVLHYQSLQKRYLPDSPEWRYASAEIYAAYAENARRHGTTHIPD